MAACRSSFRIFKPRESPEDQHNVSSIEKIVVKPLLSERTGGAFPCDTGNRPIAETGKQEMTF
jgi:hypothetical protein